jgi:hypothetical protein
MTTYAETKRWRDRHPEVKAKERLRYYRQFQNNNKRKWKKWSEQEDKQITARNKPPDSKLSVKLGRSVQAIQQRRSCLVKGVLRVEGILLHPTQRGYERLAVASGESGADGSAEWGDQGLM